MIEQTMEGHVLDSQKQSQGNIPKLQIIISGKKESVEKQP
jgi:hypothetical protein